MRPQDVVEISTVDQFKAFRDAVNSGTSYAGKTVKLTADLDLQGEDWFPIGYNTMASYPGTAFKGDFDGCNYTISNLKVKSSEPEYATAGLFGSIASGSIKNLTLKNVDVTSTHYAGGIVAYTSNGPTIENCKVIGGTIKSTPELLNGSYDNGDKAGGIMGYATAGSTINNCWVENVTITAYRDLGGIVGCSNGTVTNNTAKNVTVTQDLTNGYETSTPTTIGDIVGRGSATNNVEANGNIVIKSNPVAQIGETKYETIAEAVAAAKAGDVIEVIKAGDYTLPNLPKNVTIEGKADGEVSFTYTTANSSIASVPNGATFKNVTFNWGNVNYHGFQAAGTINMEGCTLNGKFFSYGDMNFTNCEFDQTNSDYNMWVYGAGTVVYDRCTFTNNTTGKLLHLYCEDANLQHKVTVKDCKFVNGGSLSKAAINVKATSGSNALQYELHLEGNNTYEGNFPTAVGEQDNSDHTWILSPLAQVDDRAVNPDNITVYENEVLIYPNYVAAIGDTKYTTLQRAFDAAEAGQTVTLLKDYDAKNEAMAGGTRQFVIKKSITFDGGGYTLTTKQRGIGVGNVNGDVTADIDVTIKNVTVLNTSDGARCIDTRGMIGSLTLEGVTLSTDGAPSGYTQPLTIGGNQTDAATVTITNSTIQTNDDATAYYAIITFNPVNMNITNSTIKGWANIFAKGKDGSAGSAGSVFNLDNCTLVSTNEYSGTSNAFGAFVIGDNNVTINVTNSDIQINSTGDQWQTIVSDQGNTYTEGGVNLGEGNTIMFSGKSTFAYAGNNLAVSGGVSNIPVPEAFCAEGIIPTANTDSETMEAYPYTVKVGQFVAQIGEGESVKNYETLEAAFAAANDGETIKLLADCAGNGIKAPQGKFTTGITVDFDGHTYTMDGSMVGSTGTETQAFQLLKDNKITFKNGTIYSEKAKMLVQNYSDLTLEGMTLTLKNENYNDAYTLSNNNGNIVIDGTTINANPAGSTAFDVCRYSSYTSVNVTVKGESVINGDIEVDAGAGDPKEGMFLTVEAGTINGNLRLTDGGATAITDNAEKAAVKKNNDVMLAAPADYKWKDNGDGTSTLVPCEYICAIGTTKYETLADAVAAAGTSATTITLLTEAATDGVISGDGVVVPSGSNITFDLNGLTYNVSGETVGSSGTKTSGFQLLKESNITFKNGTLKATAPTAQMLIQNYSNLTLEDVNLDGTALSGLAYALSNNCGTINLTGSTSITAKNGGRAFDTCKFGSYAIPTVNINTTGAITGPIEATGGKLNIENGKFDVTWVTDNNYTAGDIQITGGVFSAEPADEYLDEGYVVVDNTDEATMNEYPYTVKSKEDAGIFDLFDDIDYARTDDVQATKVTYTRYFSPNVTDNYQAWYIPFDYTIKDEDADNFDFYKIHLISASNKQDQDDLIEDNTKVYIHIEPIPSGTVLKANRPYVIKPKAEMTHVFEAESVTLYGMNNSIRLSMSTSEWDYNFYGTYTTFKEENQTAKQWIGLNTNGNYFWNKPSSSLHRYRWFIKVTANTDNGDYSKLNLVFIEDNDEATDISKKYLDEDEIEGIYTLDGVKVQTPVKGMNIIRFTNGKTKKINVKK